MAKLLHPEYWQAKAASVYHCFDCEILVVQSLINVIAILAGTIMAWVIARPLQSKLSAIITERNLTLTPFGRFLII